MRISNQFLNQKPNARFTISGGGPAAGDGLLDEDGSGNYILLENGGFILLD